MNLLDYILALILGYCLIRGIFRGLIKELSSIVGVLGGFYFAFTYHHDMAAPLTRWITHPGYADIFGFLILFIGVYLVISMAGVVIKYLMNIAFLGWTDRLGGALFGSIKGLLIVAVMVAMLTTFLSKNADILRESILVRQTSALSAVMVRAASADMKTLFNSHLKELEQSWYKGK